MKFIICTTGKILLLMPFLVSTSHAIALYSTLTETLYMDCVQHSSGTGPVYRVDLKMTSTSNIRQKLNRNAARQVLVPVKIIEMSHTDLCQHGVDPIFDSIDSNISLNIPQLDVIGNSGNFIGVLNAQLMAGRNLFFDITGLSNLNSTQIIAENRPKISVTNMQPQVIHGVGSSQLGVCLKVTPTISPEDNIELNVHVALSMGNSQPMNLISIPRVVMNDSSKLTVSESTTIQNFGDYTAVPVLSDIPQLGYLFKHDQELSSKKNLLILVTAQVLNCKED